MENSKTNVELNLIELLNGGHIKNESTSDLCDFTLEEQNAATEAQGLQPSASSNFLPILGKSITYIVACVIINDKNEVLMMQEAKKSCAGKWYLPAGHMEQGEHIIMAAKREVLEETGLNINVTTLLAVESAGGSWYRFVLTGTVLNGELKTPANADADSLQAKWILNLQELNLRSNDILPIIELGRNYMKKIGGNFVWHQEILPTPKCQEKNYLRVIAVIKKRRTNQIHVLISEKNAHHFPTVEIHPGRSIHATLRKFLIELFGAELPQHRPHGLLSVEHCPSTSSSLVTNSTDGLSDTATFVSPPTTTTTTTTTTTDGICLTILVAFRPALEEVTLLGKCIWQELSTETDGKLITILSSKNATIPLNVVR